MLVQKLRTTLLSAAAASALLTGVATQSANAEVIDNWNLNLSAANGVGGYSGLSNVTGVDRFNLSGLSTVIQALAFGSTVGQAFTDSGYLQLTGWFEEDGVPAGAQPIALKTGFGYNVYFRFDGLTGTVINAAGDIVFNSGVGTIALWLDDDLSDFDPTSAGTGTNGALKLADFVVDAGGGQGLAFFAGSTPTGTIQITLEQTTENGSLTGDLWTDENGDKLQFISTLHLGDLTAELQQGIGTNPVFSVDGLGNGTATAKIINNGSYNVAAVPEASTAAALGIGLLGLAGLTSRRRRKVA